MADGNGGSIDRKLIQWFLVPAVVGCATLTIRNAIAIGGGIPPEWLKSDVSMLESKLDRVQRDIAKLNLAMSEFAGNRFTSKDGLEVWREFSSVHEEIAFIRERLAGDGDD